MRRPLAALLCRLGLHDWRHCWYTIGSGPLMRETACARCGRCP